MWKIIAFITDSQAVSIIDYLKIIFFLGYALAPQLTEVSGKSDTKPRLRAGMPVYGRYKLILTPIRADTPERLNFASRTFWIWDPEGAVS